jgi:branched-chain amino acid transport system permease protein
MPRQHLACAARPASLIVLALWAEGLHVYILSIAGANILAAVGLNLLMGYAGQVSIGQAAFLAIGGYTSALLMTKLGLSFWLAFPLAGMLTSLTGLILFIPALRLGTIYLAIATLGFGAAVQQLIPLPYWSAILGGHQGIRVPRPQSGASSSILI